MKSYFTVFACVMLVAASSWAGQAYWPGSEGGTEWWDLAWGSSGAHGTSPTSYIDVNALFSIDANAITGYRMLASTPQGDLAVPQTFPAFLTPPEFNMWKNVAGVSTVAHNIKNNSRVGFTFNDGTPAMVPDNYVYTVEASWDVNSPTQVEYDGVMSSSNRLMVGMQYDPEKDAGHTLGNGGGIGDNEMMQCAGLEYAVGVGWRVSSHNRQFWGNREVLAPQPTKFAIKITHKMAAADGTITVAGVPCNYPANSPVVTFYYSCNGAPWKVGQSAYSSNLVDFPLYMTSGFNWKGDQGPDMLCLSVRGSAGKNFKVAWYGNGIPSVNGASGQMDFNSDGVGNDWAAFLGMDPIGPNAAAAGVPVAGIVALGLLGAGLAAAGVRRMRSRR